MFRLNGLV